MKVNEVIEKVLEYYPQFPEDYDGCDGYKSGNPNVECTGIVSALVPTIEVIQKCIALNCNLLYVHEPSYYSTPDYPDWRADFQNKVYEEKRALLEQHNITIWRDHDHIHAHKPDGIFTGVIKYLGWEKNLIKQEEMTYLFQFESMTVETMNEILKEKLSLHGIRYIGNPKDTIKTVALVGHLIPNIWEHHSIKEGNYAPEYATQVIKLLETKEVDAIIPGEVIDWTVLSYIRDAVHLGKSKAAFLVGHFNLEELGMKYAAEHLSKLLNESIPVHYVPSKDMYNYQ